MKRNILLLSLFTFYFVTNSQIPQVITNLQSPNTAGLGLYGEIPVSLFTGIPEISIPIFAAPDKYNNFKIFLNYHAGGVRPDQHPGWVGTNWTLFAGCCITRTVKDSDDEFKPLKTGKEIGFFYNYSFLNKNDWNTLDNIKNVILNHKSLNYIDTQPDEFSFNFGNYTGKFY